MQGRGGGWQNLKIDAIFLDFGDTFLKPDFGGCCAVEEAGVEGAGRGVWGVSNWTGSAGCD